MIPEPTKHPDPPDCNPPTVNRKAVRRDKALKRTRARPAPDRNRRIRERRRA